MSLEDQSVWPWPYNDTTHSRKGSRPKLSNLSNLYWQQTSQSLVDWTYDSTLGAKNDYTYWNIQPSISLEVQQILGGDIQEAQRRAARDVYSLLAQVEALKKKSDADDAEKAALNAENQSFRSAINVFYKSESALKAEMEKLTLEMEYCEEDREDALRQNQVLRAEIKSLQGNWTSLAMDIINLKPQTLDAGAFSDEEEYSDEDTGNIADEEDYFDEDTGTFTEDTGTFAEEVEFLAEKVPDFVDDEVDDEMGDFVDESGYVAEDLEDPAEYFLEESPSEPRGKNVLLLRHERELQFERALNASLNERVAALEIYNAKLTESIATCWLYRLWQWVAWLFNELRRQQLKLNSAFKDKYE